jgi:serine phosphatase RsbU (regulator of sigma subunit)
MELRYPTPADLVEALQQRRPGAREQLWQTVREPLARLLEQLSSQKGLQLNSERLVLHALHLAETGLRTRPAREFRRQTWAAFRAGVLLQVAKLALQPYGDNTPARMGPAPLPPSQRYHVQTVFLPYDQIGGLCFGGDWYAGRQTQTGALWVLVADVTGHGYYAYLLASSLPAVWQMLWRERVEGPEQPADLLADLHRLLADCLPDGIYVEGTLIRLDPQGQATVVPAGGTRFLLRRGGALRPELVLLPGAWLGLSPPRLEDQHCLELAGGDEILVGTDGLFDQLAVLKEADWLDLLEARSPGQPLFERVQDLLRQALQQAPQRDDITALLLRRRPGAVLLPPEPVAGQGSNDVPV